MGVGAVTDGIGHGLPWWLPEGFLNVEQTLALGEASLVLGAFCPVCRENPPQLPTATGPMDPAHIVDKGMGGRPNGSGPTVRICRSHHDLLHFSADGIQRTLAVREDGAVCWLEHEVLNNGTVLCKEEVRVTVLGHVHPWEW